MPKARAVELLSQYSGLSERHIYRLTNVTKGAQNEIISEKQPIKIEPAIKQEGAYQLDVILSFNGSK